MSLWDILLYALPVMGLMFSIVAVCQKALQQKSLLVMSLLSLFFSSVHLTVFGVNYIAVPAYLATLMIFFMAIFVKRKGIRLVGACLAAFLLLVPVLTHFTFIKFYGIYTSMSYSSAFKALNLKIADQYPFTQLKQIDFDLKYETFLKAFMEAEKNHDPEAYYIALRDYVRSFPDGHMQLAHGDSLLFEQNPALTEAATHKNIGGSYGFTVLERDDGMVVAGLVEDGSDIQKAGLKTGLEVMEWKGMPVKEYAANIPALWTKKNAARPDHLKRLQNFLLTRGAIGEKAELTFKDQNGEIRAVSLTALEDHMGLYTKDMDIFYRKIQVQNLTGKIVGSKRGYIRLNAMPEDSDGEAYRQLAATLSGLKEKGIKDLIIDLRGNVGGSDSFGASVMGLFSKENLFYQSEYTYDPQKGYEYQNTTRVVSTYQGLDVPIILLVNHHCISAGEGFVYNMRKLPNVRIAGMTGTHGSFGTIDGAILMPHNLVVLYPQAANFDEDGHIMIDTNHEGKGGIKPDIIIPLDHEAVKSLYEDKMDYELAYMIEYLEEQ